MNEGVGEFVHLVHLVVGEGRFDELVEDVRETSLRALSAISGFKNLAVLVSNDRLHIVVLSTWERRNDWARALWEQEIQDALVLVYRKALRFDPRSYYEVFRYPSPSSGRNVPT
jgi:hypothetical protein